LANDVTITEAIEQLRAQLEEAQRRGADQEIRFLTKSVEVEFTITFRTGIEGKAGTKAWFLDVSGNAKRDKESTHKVKLTLEAVDRSGRPTLVHDSR
jgi:hypothetical protein